MKDLKKDEFKTLDQCGMFVNAYEVNFHVLSKYVTQLVTIEEERIHIFNRDRILSSKYYLSI